MANWQQVLFSALIPLVLATGGCDALNPNRQIMTQISTRLIAPGPNVQRLLSVQRTQDTQVERFWSEKHTQQEDMQRVEQLYKSLETIYPGRNIFLSAMAVQSAEAVPANTYLRMLEDSHVKCSKPIYTTKFVKVKVTSGPLNGHIGGL